MKLELVRRIAANMGNAYFRRLFVSYAVIASLISCLCLAFLYDRAGDAAIDELERHSGGRLANIRAYVENAYPNDYKNAFVSNLLSAADSPGRDAFSVFYEEYGQNVYQMYHLANHLKTIVEAHPEAENITVYFKSTRFMVDKFAFFPMGERTTGAPLIDRLQAEEVPTNRWLQRSVDYGEGVSDQLMTYVYSFPEQARGKDIQGYLMIDVRADRFREVLDKLLESTEEKLLMYSMSDGYIIGSGNVADTDIADIKHSWERRDNGGVRGDISLLAPAEGGSEEWGYAIVRPSGTLAPAAEKMRRNIKLASIGAVALGMLTAYFLAYKSYRPVRSMLLRLKERSGGLYPSQLRNEFLAIDQVMTGLYNRINQMSQQLNRNSLHAMLNGRLAEDEMPAQVPAAGGYVAVNIKLAGSTAREVAAVLQRKSAFMLIVIEKDDSELDIIYHDDETGNLRERVRLELLNILPAAAGNGEYAAGMGSTVHTREEIAKSHEYAASALQYTFLLGMNQIFDYDVLCRRDEIPQIGCEPFENALRAGDTEAVRQYIAEFAEQLKNRPVPLEMARFALMQLTMTLSKVIIGVNAKERMFSDVLPFQMARQGSFDESVASIREQSVQIAGHIGRHLLKHAQHEVIYSLREYIDNHLHEDISLDQLADMAGLSTTYLSRQFKEIAGVSFIEYLTNTRMRRACELLQSSQLTITDITARTGYNNVQYFCSRFKTKFGVTPNQYRNAFKQGGDKPAHAERG